tara:strand:+ start:1234 stop:1482 length:249 start_codon:yes stop_codon:yes gene_type:complete
MYKTNKKNTDKQQLTTLFNYVSFVFFCFLFVCFCLISQAHNFDLDLTLENQTVTNHAWSVAGNGSHLSSSSKGISLNDYLAM